MVETPQKRPKFDPRWNTGYHGTNLHASMKYSGLSDRNETESITILLLVLHGIFNGYYKGSNLPFFIGTIEFINKKKKKKKRVNLLTIWQKSGTLEFNQEVRRESHTRNSKGTYDIFDLCTFRLCYRQDMGLIFVILYYF